MPPEGVSPVLDRATRVRRYRDWLHTQNLRFGFADELAACCLKVRRGVENDAPPDALWPAILPTVRLVETMRERFGPTVITSAYRSKAYNRAVYADTGVEPTDSEHSRHTAIDFSCKDGTPLDWRRALLELRIRGEFAGGIGLYHTFVHVDTRGRNADWRG